MVTRIVEVTFDHSSRSYAVHHTDESGRCYGINAGISKGFLPDRFTEHYRSAFRAGEKPIVHNTTSWDHNPYCVPCEGGGMFISLQKDEFPDQSASYAIRCFDGSPDNRGQVVKEVNLLNNMEAVSSRLDRFICEAQKKYNTALPVINETEESWPFGWGPQD